MRKRTTEQFIKEAKEIHNNFYDYSLVDYKNKELKVKIICPIHGEFEQIAGNHLRGAGCMKCRDLKHSKKIISDKETFIKKANKIHNNFYDYSLVNYINSRIKVKIICPKHGVFEQTPKAHLQNEGCPKCNSSKGEREIRNYLKSKNIIFEEQKKFEDLNKLSYDFYLPEEKLLIEYNGEQHYETIKHFGGGERFVRQQQNDLLKSEYAKNNNLKLLTIPYWDYKIIEEILEENIG